mgnify:CR=1 FL=1
MWTLELVKKQIKCHLQSQPILSDFVALIWQIYQTILLEQYDKEFCWIMSHKFVRFYCTIMLEQFDEKFRRIFVGFCLLILTDLLDNFAVFHWTILLEQFAKNSVQFCRILSDKFDRFYWTNLPHFVGQFCWSNLTKNFIGFSPDFLGRERFFFRQFCHILSYNFVTKLMDDFAKFDIGQWRNWHREQWSLRSF